MRPHAAQHKGIIKDTCVYERRHGDLSSGEVSPFSLQDVGSTFQNQIVKKWLEIFPIFFQILVEGSFLD